MNDNQTYEVRNILGTGIFTIEKKGEKYILLEYEGTDEKVEIPEEVTSIGDKAFYNCGNLMEIKLPKGITSIGNSAFSNCASLKEIKLPKGVTSIGDKAFHNCQNLTEIKLPEGVTSIGAYAFSSCSSLSEIKLPEELTSIERNSFSECSSLSEIKLPKGVTSIGDYAFSGCSSLSEIKLPEGLTSIGDNAFHNCKNLTEIKLPEGVTSIGWYAFSSCSSLSEIKLPEGLTSIGDNAFSSCSSLSEIKLPEELTSIGINAFSGCKLSNIEIPKNVTIIGNNAFQANIRLKKIKHGKITYSIEYPKSDWFYGNIIEKIIKKKDNLPILIPNNIVAENILKKIFSKLEADEIANFISIYDEENFIKNVDLLQKVISNDENNIEVEDKILEIILKNKNFASIDIEETALKNYEYLVSQKIIDEKLLQRIYFEYNGNQLLSEILKNKTQDERKNEIIKILKQYYDNPIDGKHRIPDLLFTLCVENNTVSKLELRDRLLATSKIIDVDNLDDEYTRINIKEHLKSSYFDIVKEQDKDEFQKLGNFNLKTLQNYFEINYFDGIRVSLHRKLEGINEKWTKDFYRILYNDDKKLIINFFESFDVTKEWNNYIDHKERASHFRNELISRLLYTSLKNIKENNVSEFSNKLNELIRKIKTDGEHLKNELESQSLHDVIEKSIKSSNELFEDPQLIEMMITLNPYSYDTIKKLDLSDEERIKYASIALKSGYLFSKKEIDNLKELDVRQNIKDSLNRKMNLKNYVEYINNEIGIKKIPEDKRIEFLNKVKNITKQYCANANEEDLLELLRMSDLYLRENTEIGIQMYLNEEAKETVEKLFDYQNPEFNNTDRLLYSLYSINQIAHNSESIALSVYLLEDSRFALDDPLKIKYKKALNKYNELVRMGISIEKVNIMSKSEKLINNINKYNDPECSEEMKSIIKDSIIEFLEYNQTNEDIKTEESLDECFDRMVASILDVNELTENEKTAIKIFSDEANTFFEVKRVAAKTIIEDFLEKDENRNLIISSLFLPMDKKQEFFANNGYIIEIQETEIGPTLVCYSEKFNKPFSVHLKDLPPELETEISNKIASHTLSETIYHKKKDVDNLGILVRTTPIIAKEEEIQTNFSFADNNSKFITEGKTKNQDFAISLSNFSNYDYYKEKGIIEINNQKEENIEKINEANELLTNALSSSNKKEIINSVLYKYSVLKQIKSNSYKDLMRSINKVGKNIKESSEEIKIEDFELDKFVDTKEIFGFDITEFEDTKKELITTIEYIVTKMSNEYDIRTSRDSKELIITDKEDPFKTYNIEAFSSQSNKSIRNLQIKPSMFSLVADEKNMILSRLNLKDDKISTTILETSHSKGV